MKVADTMSRAATLKTGRRRFVQVSAVLAAGGVSGYGSRVYAADPLWTPIPDQRWIVGVPVRLDLADYCMDPDGDGLTFSLDMVLPPGVSMSGSVISGVPTSVFGATDFVATADDGVTLPATDAGPAPGGDAAVADADLPGADADPFGEEDAGGAGTGGGGTGGGSSGGPDEASGPPGTIMGSCAVGAARSSPMAVGLAAMAAGLLALRRRRGD